MQFAFARNFTSDPPTSRLVAEGELQWQHGEAARLAVLPSLLSAAEVRSLRGLLSDGAPAFDMDPDTVDEMATHELYLLNEKRGEPPSIVAQRAPLRQAVNALLSPIIDERITPFVAQRFAGACGPAGSPTACTPCFSLVRRYRPDERRTHQAHFDVQALATVVISLSSAGADYPASSGLYVSSGAERRYLALQAGDAVVHQSDLLHGVDLAAPEEELPPADDPWERWSWILWYKDSSTCEERGHLWNAAAAEQGKPLAAFLHAHRLHLDPQLPARRAAAEKARYMRASAEGGFGRAMNELGRMLKDGDGVPADAAAAARWFRKALEASEEPDAAFNLGQLLLEHSAELAAADEGGGEEGGGAAALRGALLASELADPLGAAVGLFRRAAAGGCGLACHNLGVASMRGVGGVERNASAAARWFERAGSAEAMFQAAKLHASTGEGERAARWLRRAANAGSASAREALQQRTTSTKSEL